MVSAKGAKLRKLGKLLAVMHNFQDICKRVKEAAVMCDINFLVIIIPKLKRGWYLLFVMKKFFLKKIHFKI